MAEGLCPAPFISLPFPPDWGLLDLDLDPDLDQDLDQGLEEIK